MSNKTLLVLLSLCLINICGCEDGNTGLNLQEQKSLPPISPNTATRTYPCQNCDVVRLDTFMPAQVEAGLQFEYKIRVTNLTDGILTNVEVTNIIIKNFQHKQSNPPAVVEDNKLKWIFPEFGANETKEITGTAIAISGGVVQNYVDISYRMPIRTQIVSLKPNIVITKSAPAEISVCAPIIYIFKVENTGTIAADNLRIYDTLPQGLITTNGDSNIDIPVGTLPAGTVKILTAAVKALRSGTYTNSAVAVADKEVTVESGEVTTVVRKPVLTIKNTGPETDYVNREVTYNIAVTNTGDWPAIDTVIENAVPAGMKFIRAYQGGILTNNKVVWKIPKINSGSTVNISAAYIASTLGTIENTVKASGVCADTVTAIAKTIFKGAPGILLEVGDTLDPIKVGEMATYKIVVTNQGSVPVTNISIKATLEDKMGYVSNVGATKGNFSENGIITFESLPFLAPRTQSIWEVTVRAVKVGDVRFKAELTGDQLDTTVMETESTHFFE